MFRTLLLLVAVFSATTAVGQRPPMKWGDIPDEHLQMMDFPADTNAAAVILGDFGETSFENWNQVYRIHRRVKLLRESSYEDFGTVNISYPTGRNGARVGDLKAQTVVLGADGKKTVHKVDRGSFFKERLEHDWERLSFTFPALQPGAIVEYSYEVNLPSNFFLAPWAFQKHEPVLYSEYRVEFPGQLQYVVSAVGNAKDGDLRCKYGVLTWNAETRAWNAEIHKLDYPLAETEAHILASDLPNPKKTLKKLLEASY